MIRIDPRALLRLDEIRRSLLKLVPDLSHECSAKTANALFEQARAGAMRHNKTGALVRSLKIRSLGNDRYQVYHDLSVAPHAKFVHWGTKPHIIRPKYKNVLRFVPRGGNDFVFAKIVHHPGYKGDPYLVRARTSVAQRFSTIAREAWARIKRGFRGT